MSSSLLKIYFCGQDFFPVVGTLRQDAAEWIGDEGASPEFQAGSLRFIAPNIASLEADPIHDAHVHPIGDRVGALNRFPGVVLGFAELRFLRRMPANGGRVEKQYRALQGGQAGSFRIPLIPADQRTNSYRLLYRTSENPDRPA